MLCGVLECEIQNVMSGFNINLGDPIQKNIIFGGQYCNINRCALLNLPSQGTKGVLKYRKSIFKEKYKISLGKV